MRYLKTIMKSIQTDSEKTMLVALTVAVVLSFATVWYSLWQAFQ